VIYSLSKVKTQRFATFHIERIVWVASRYEPFPSRQHRMAWPGYVMVGVGSAASRLVPVDTRF